MTRSEGRKIITIASTTKPIERIPRRRRKPHAIPIPIAAEPIAIAAKMLEMAMVERVDLNPYVDANISFSVSF